MHVLDGAVVARIPADRMLVELGGVENASFCSSVQVAVVRAFVELQRIRHGSWEWRFLDEFPE
jgi:hypothetical protein